MEEKEPEYIYEKVNFKSVFEAIDSVMHDGVNYYDVDGDKVEVTTSDRSIIELTAYYDDIYTRKPKPKTMMIGDVEVPAPEKESPTNGTVVYFINTNCGGGYDSTIVYPDFEEDWIKDGIWLKEDDIKQVVAAWRKLIKESIDG